MSRRPVTASTAYDEDFYAWTQHQARVLRTTATLDNRLDRERLAEEIADLGKGERDAVRSQVRRIIEHLLKLQFSPAAPPRFEWQETIAEARAILSDKLTATLRQDVEARLATLYNQAHRKAALGLKGHGEAEAAALLPSRCPYTLDDLARDDWYPPRAEGPAP